jgi:hypothetical protein
MAGTSADEIDEMGDGVTRTARTLKASAEERRRKAREEPGLRGALHAQIADLEDETADALERNEQTMHALADLERRADGD